MKVDLPNLGLQNGHRLEPTELHPDIADLEPESAPRRVVWWLRREETFARRRCPLFNPGIGVTIDSIAPDWLHTLSLGIVQHVVGIVMWMLLDLNVCGIDGSLLVRTDLSVIQFRAEFPSGAKCKSAQASLTREFKALWLRCWALATAQTFASTALKPMAS